jgi:hypothetical protein
MASTEASPAFDDLMENRLAHIRNKLQLAASSWRTENMGQQERGRGQRPSFLNIGKNCGF